MKTLFFFGALIIVVISATENCCGISTVTVSGTGKVTGVPDIATFSVTYSDVEPKTQAATANVNKLISSALQVLANNGVLRRDISTGQYSVNPEYDYPNGTQRLIGQRASQTLNIKLRNISSQRVGKLLDDLSAINGSQISGLNFDIENKKPLEAQARRIAYSDARSKALQYSQLSNLVLGSPLSINEGSSYQPPVFYAVDTKVAGGNGAQVPLGENEVQINVNIIWKLGL